MKKENKEDEEKVKKLRKSVIKQIDIKLQELGELIEQDDTLKPKDKLVQVDVILDVIKFLQHYKENTEILNSYWLNQNWKNKFNKGNDR